MVKNAKTKDGEIHFLANDYMTFCNVEPVMVQPFNPGRVTCAKCKEVRELFEDRV